MKTATFSVLLCMLSFVLLGCDQMLRRPRIEPRSPTGLCEVVGAKYKFVFEEDEIVSLQPLVRKNRIVLLLGDSKAHTVAFLIRHVWLDSQAEPLRNVETFTLSYPGRVLKLEESPAEEGYIKFRGKEYTAFVSYDLEEWLPLTESPLAPGELEKDLALMEKSWETAFRLEYVRECEDYYAASQKRFISGGSTNCLLDDALCILMWGSALDGVFSDDDGWFSEPPIGGGIDFDDIDWDPFSPTHSGRVCNRRRASKPDCPAGYSVVPGWDADFHKELTIIYAKINAELDCSKKITIWGKPRICETKISHGETLYEVWIKGCCPPPEPTPTDGKQ